MTAENFCYWFQGYIEIASADGGTPPPLTAKQVALVMRHLALVFVHDIDPKAGGADVQAILNGIHDGTLPFVRPDPDKPVMRC